MFNLDLISKCRSILSIQQLSQFINLIQSEFSHVQCALLIPRNIKLKNSEVWLGKISKEVADWIKTEEVRIQLEGEHAFLPLHYKLSTSSLCRGFVLNSSTPAYHSPLFVVEYLNGELKKSDVFNFMTLCPYIINAYHRIKISKGDLLTKRELECMNWIAKGKTSWEVAKIIGLSERTINFHIQRCIDKTESVNRIQAISKCTMLNLINPN
ncbi:helix-turn-helix transcriptional regulator [uncultured Shewanella sp.]|uniref:helix-turn-helix domain-containing protein n=1 Tax=uncultured Shewanella sp. TaxID=173975 RepID=UPI00260C5B7F|nr:helix-turn-helix transcriptional regulator [uncultured Shewanella sp.]